MKQFLNDLKNVVLALLFVLAMAFAMWLAIGTMNMTGGFRP